MLILKRRPTIISVLSFNAEVLKDQANLHHAGIQMGVPKNVDMSKEDFQKSFMGFGFFGSSSDPNKFYPGLNVADDVMPKPEDFVDIPFRFISASIVGGESWKATDFSQPGVLKASVPKLANKPMFTEHDQDVNNWIGLVADPYWDEVSSSDDIDQVPPGINGMARIDAKTNPKIARGLIFGALGSNSVTTAFAWQPSHSFKDMNEFNERIGSFDSDGKMVRRIATEIYDYHESSIVWLGADAFSKRIVNGKLINVDTNSVYFSKADPKEKKVYEEEKTFDVDFCIDEKIISLSKEKTKVTFNNNPQKQDKMKNFLLLFMAAAIQSGMKFSFTYTDGMALTADQEKEITDAFGKINQPVSLTQEQTDGIALATNVRSLALTAAKAKDPAATTVDMTSFLAENSFIPNTEVAELAAARTTITELVTASGAPAADKLKETVVALKADAEIGKQSIAFKRSEGVRLYKASLGKKVEDPAIISLINTSTGATLDGLIKQYGDVDAMQYGAFCTHCNSKEHIEMRSSIASDPDNAQVETGGFIDSGSLREKHGGSRMFLNGGK